MKRTGLVSILIPDGESHMLIYVVNCLKSKKNYRIHVMSSSRNSEMKYSRHISSYIFYPDNGNDAQWIKNIDNEVVKYGIDLIMPIWETGIRRILLNKSLLESSHKLSLLPSQASFDLAIDKWDLYNYLVKNEIACPKTILYNNLKKNNNQEFPYVVKPTKGFGGGMQIMLLNNKADLIRYFEDKELHKHKFILQQYVNGIDYTVSIICLSGKVLAHTIQRSEDKENQKFGPQMKYQFVNNDRLFTIITGLMETLQWSGIASVDIRYDTKVDEYKILEINPRFWRSVYGSLYAGINFPHLLAILTMKGKIEKIKPYKIIQFYDLKGFVASIRENPMRILDVSLLHESTPLKTVMLDPIPYIYKYISRSKNIFLRKFLKNKIGA